MGCYCLPALSLKEPLSFLPSTMIFRQHHSKLAYALSLLLGIQSATAMPPREAMQFVIDSLKSAYSPCEGYFRFDEAGKAIDSKTQEKMVCYPGQLATLIKDRETRADFDRDLLRRYKSQLQEMPIRNVKNAYAKCVCGGTGWMAINPLDVDLPAVTRKFLDYLRRCRDHPDEARGIFEFQAIVIEQYGELAKFGDVLPYSAGRDFAKKFYGIHLDAVKGWNARVLQAPSWNADGTRQTLMNADFSMPRRYRRRLVRKVQRPKLSCDCCPLAT